MGRVRTGRVICGAVLLALMLHVGGADADTYKCTDLQGHTAYQDTPCGGAAPSRPIEPTPKPVISAAQAHADLESQAMECTNRNYNAWIQAQPRPWPGRDARIAKLMEFGNACRRPLHLPDMVNHVPPEPPPVLSGPAGAAAAADLEKLVSAGSVAQLAKYLSTSGADINARPGTDKSLLDYATEQKQLEIARYLIEHGARVDAQQMEGRDRGLTALHRAAVVDAADVAELLIDHGAIVNAHGPLGVTPLILAAGNGSRRTAEVLLKHGADILTATGKLKTALSEATDHGHPDIVQLLLTYAPVPSQGNLDQLAIRGDVEPVRLTLMHDALVHDVPSSSKDSALRFAILGDPARSAERKQIIELLLEHGADVNNRINNAPTTPILMVRTADILQVFLDHGAEVRTNAPHGGLPEAIACNRDVKDPVSMFTVLLAHGVRLTTSDQAGPNVLQCAVMTHHPELETFLLAHGVPPDLRDASGRTALFGALDQASMDPLLQHGADINAMDAKHATPLSDAIAQGRQLQAQLLLALGAKGQGTANINESPLSSAATSGQLSVVASLVAKGVDVNAKNRLGNTPLHLAIDADQNAVAEFLIAHGADINSKGRLGRTPLHFAASRNNAALVALLLSRHADVSVRDDEGLPAERRATSEDVLAVFARVDPSVDSRLPGAADSAACAEVIRSAAWSGVGRSGRDEGAEVSHDPSDDWDRLNPGTARRPLHLQNHDYVLGLEDGPLYLARRGPDGVEGIVCEFAASPGTRPQTYHVMSGLERLQAGAQRNAISLSRESVRVVGLWGARALLEARRRRVDPDPLAAGPDENPLGDVIKAHRDDILRFYLEHGVDPNMRWTEPAGEAGVRRSVAPDEPLFTAVRYGTPDSIQLLLKHGANPDAMGEFRREPVLAWAVRYGLVATVQTLLEHGADPNLPASPYAMSETLDDIFRQDPLADAQADAIHRLLLHGADANPWLFGALFRYARAKERNDLLIQTQTSQHPVRSEWIQSAIATAGPKDARVEAMLIDAMAIRDVGACGPGKSPAELAICLPNTLKSADSSIDDRFAGAAKDRQAHWLAHLDTQCSLHVPASLTRAGWLSYVLSDQSRAKCVLGAMQTSQAARHLDLPLVTH